jgi:hypothetical protein
MKVSRDALKSMVKELLVEVLSEGLGNVQASAGRLPAPGRPPISAIGEQRRRQPTFDPRLDTPMGGGRQPSNALREAVKREAGGNPVMADILADTAMTTLPSMLSHGDVGVLPSGGGVSRDHMPVQQEQFNGTPEEAFGDGASRWADLAFMDAPKKKTA